MIEYTDDGYLKEFPAITKEEYEEWNRRKQLDKHVNILLAILFSSTIISFIGICTPFHAFFGPIFMTSMIEIMFIGMPVLIWAGPSGRAPWYLKELNEKIEIGDGSDDEEYF